ncbi:MAG: hypothetical protein IK137_04245 [Bacilli bacterium]|nr:hypothetical protein [Bacilli bacterium]
MEDLNTLQKYRDKPSKNGYMYKVIKVPTLLWLIKRGKKYFKGYWVEGKEEEENEIENTIIEGITFEDCEFYGINVGNTVIKNCSFIDCETGFLYFHHNSVIDCYSDQVLLDFFTNIRFNTFDNVKGNTIKGVGFNTFNKNNVFRNMNLDGFTGMLYQEAFTEGMALKWQNNFFHNTSISIDTISKLCDDARFIWNGSNDWEQSEEREIIEDVVSEWNGPDNFIIDMSNMSKSGKINLVASLFTKLCKGNMFIVYEDYEISSKSTIDFHTINNPLPIKIISSDGNIVDTSKMMDINIKTSFDPNFKSRNTLRYLLYDGKDLEYLYTDDYDITNPKNHSCKKLIKNTNN